MDLPRINGLDLFSGIGGISIALEPWVNTIAYCEQDRFAQSVLLSRMADGSIERAPIWDDVTSLRGAMLPSIDIIFGGFPCQDISVAGTGAGLEGKRSGLFYEIIRLVKETNPSFVFLENVPAIRTRGLSDIINAFTEVGYDCRWTCISAASVGAPHKRERWFLLAYANCAELRQQQGWGRRKERERKTLFSHDVKEESMADTMCKGLEGQRSVSFRTSKKLDNFSDDSWWSTEPSVGRVADGVQHRSHRIKSLGNSVVPMQVRKAFKTLAGIGE